MLPSTVAFRLNGDYAVFSAPSLAHKYQLADSSRRRAPMRLVDCGAYLGDTIVAPARNAFHFAAVAAFEPDSANLTQLQQHVCTDCHTGCFPCGVSDATT